MHIVCEYSAVDFPSVYSAFPLCRMANINFFVKMIDINVSV